MNKKLIRSNKAQINYLCEYMLANPSFAAGEYRSPIKSDKEWQTLKKALDELGPKRTIEQWKICWRDQKRKAKSEAAALRRNSTVTSDTAPILNNSEDSFHEESPIGCKEELNANSTPSPPLGVAWDFDDSNASTSQILPSISVEPLQRKRKKSNQIILEKKFLNAQTELNSLIKELIVEVRRSNELREEHLKFLRGENNGK